MIWNIINNVPKTLPPKVNDIYIGIFKIFSCMNNYSDHQCIRVEKQTRLCDAIGLTDIERLVIFHDSMWILFQKLF